MKNIAIIPARSGSKGLPNKNIKSLDGKPLISYTIDAAKKSGIFDTIMVSTDSKLYSDISKEFGADVPFLRSASNSSDNASSWDVVREVLMNYKDLGKTFDNVFLLQPTSPLRTEEDIKGAYSFFIEKNADFVETLCAVDHPPVFANVLPEDLSLKNFENKAFKNARRQDIPNYYRENGAIYIIKTNILFTLDDFYLSNCFAYIMDKRKSIDIDDDLDFLIAETILKNKQEY